ncbi:lysosomal alpha-mannosidase-like [Amblyomma americanum]
MRLCASALARLQLSQPACLVLLYVLWPIHLVRTANVCELKGCPKHKPGHINMHVLSHSHLDAGWIEPLDTIYENSVRLIYNTSLDALSQNPNRRFVSAENIYFSRWWREQPSDIKNTVRDFVQSGRLQFVGGGWVQNDEAVTHYTAIIDQMTMGLRFLNDTFGPQCGVPSVAWQADPFGHTTTMATLFARMGFSSLFLGRISIDMKEKWRKSHSMEFVWDADSRKYGGESKGIFAWVPENSYVNPEAISFDPEICPDPHKPYPVTEEEAPSLLLAYAQHQTGAYTNDTVAFMSGCDLCYVNAHCRFQKQEAFMAEANRLSQKGIRYPPVHVVQSTPACYIEFRMRCS